MQTVRNILFYISPLVGAVLGGMIGLNYHIYWWVTEIIIGLILGCAISVLMVVLSVIARLKAEPGLKQPDPKTEDTSSSDSKQE